MITEGKFNLLFSIIGLLSKKKNGERGKGDKENTYLDKKDTNNHLDILKVYKVWKLGFLIKLLNWWKILELPTAKSFSMEIISITMI